MCENCNDIQTLQLSSVQVYEYDPTRTTTLRNKFVSESNRRWDKVAAEIKVAVVDEDVFGLKEPAVFQTPGRRAYEFKTLPEKVDAFNKWIQSLLDREILSIGEISTGRYSEWWGNTYIFDSYKRAVLRGRSELIRAGYNVPSIEESGGIHFVLSNPVHIEMIGLMFIRAFNEFKGVTDDMALMISKVLAQGLLDGDNPLTVAQKLVAVINGNGADKLGIYDTLGRYIPGKRRAEIIARTEIIRAYHKAAMREYVSWRADGVYVKAEFITAGDDRVCSICDAIEANGKIYTLEEAENLIPVHPQCRCIVLPVFVKDTKRE